MAIVQIYTHPELRTFRSSLCSKATLFGLFSFLLTVLPPFFVAYASRSFWLKEDFYSETPRIGFRHRVLAILGSVDGDARVFSTYQNFNLLHADSLVPTSVSAVESSSDVVVKLDFRTGPSFRVHSLSLILVFEYRLSAYVELTMEGMAFVQRSTPMPSSRLYFDGELRLRQKTPLPHRGRVTAFNVSVIDADAVSVDDFDLSHVLKTYKDRDLRLELTSVDHVWSPGNDGNFIVEGRLRYPQERVAYRPGVAQLLKWAWIQYLSIFVIFVFVIEKIRAFVFLNQIIPTIVDSRLEKFKRQ